MLDRMGSPQMAAQRSNSSASSRTSPREITMPTSSRLTTRQPDATKEVSSRCHWLRTTHVSRDGTVRSMALASQPARNTDNTSQARIRTSSILHSSALPLLSVPYFEPTKRHAKPKAASSRKSARTASTAPVRQMGIYNCHARRVHTARQGPENLSTAPLGHYAQKRATDNS